LREEIDQRKGIEKERDELLWQAQHQAAELNAILDSIPSGLTISDMAGRIVRMNDIAMRMLDSHPESMEPSVRGRLKEFAITTVDGKPFQPEDSPTNQALHGAMVQDITQVIRRRDSQLWLSVSAAPIRMQDGECLGAVTTFIDVTRTHEIQEQLKTFIHMVSHDLRIPLTIMRGHADLLRERLGEDDSQPARESVDAIKRSVTRMNVMINDLVDAARLEGGQEPLTLRPVALPAYLPEFLKRNTSPLCLERIRLDLATDLPPIPVDEPRLERVLLNLLSNAQKYSAPETPILLRARCLDNGVAVSVIDQGQGIHPDDIPHLFKKFYRARGERRAEGIGLGLYISRLLVEAHGGSIEVKSEEGKGSTFTIILPADKG